MIVSITASPVKVRVAVVLVRSSHMPCGPRHSSAPRERLNSRAQRKHHKHMRRKKFFSVFFLVIRYTTTDSLYRFKLLYKVEIKSQVIQRSTRKHRRSIALRPPLAIFFLSSISHKTRKKKIFCHTTRKNC